MARRKLSVAEQEYIANHKELGAEALSADMTGIGAKTVQAFIDSLPPDAPSPEMEKTETLDEYHERLKDSVPEGDNESVKRLLARDPERGIVMMTEGASAMIDARRHIRIAHPQERIKKSDKIFIMDKTKKCR